MKPVWPWWVFFAAVAAGWVGYFIAPYWPWHLHAHDSRVLFAAISAAVTLIEGKLAVLLQRLCELRQPQSVDLEASQRSMREEMLHRYFGEQS